MKKSRYFSLLLFLLAGFIQQALAQAPQAFKYQAVARQDGALLENQPITVEVNILKDGNLAYSEMHNTATNEFGLFSLNVGMGDNPEGDFSEISWGEGSYTLKVKVGDLELESPILAVPYALYAENAKNSEDDGDWEKNGENVFYSAGRVGIGTDNPTHPLDVNGTIRSSNFLTNGDWSAIRMINSDGAGNFRWEIAPSGKLYLYEDNSQRFFIACDNITGGVGIGFDNPTYQLDVNGTTRSSKFLTNGDWSAIRMINGDGAGDFRWEIAPSGKLYLYEDNSQRFFIACDNITGGVGIGFDNPTYQLDVNGTTRSSNFLTNGDGAAIRMINGDGAGDFRWEINPSGKLYLYEDNSQQYFIACDNITGRIGIGTSFPTAKLDVNGNTKTKVLEITGGGDLAEGFDIASSTGKTAPQPGYLVSIDPEHPGQLMVTTEAYDQKLAGVISGANGIQPGMVMGQEGTLVDGQYPVALTGRVYVWADAAYGSIEPGDMLTSSPNPGFAMKVLDFEKAQGAVIGKAMSYLMDGKEGYILVLIQPH